MNELTNIDLLAMIAREHQEEMLCEAKTRVMLRQSGLRPTLILATTVVVIIATMALAVWGML